MTEVDEIAEKRMERQMPKPRGYHLLIGLPEVEEFTEGGIVKPDEMLRTEEVGSIVGLVLEMGPDAYKDEKRFPSGPYCEEGDWILMQSYSGTRFSLQGKEFRLINDDSVKAVVEDPRGIRKL